MTMFGLVLLGVLNRIYGFGKTIPSFFTQRDVLAPVILVVFIIITGVYATHLDEWWHEVRQIIPVLGLPIVLYWLPPMTERQYKGIYAALAVLCAIAAVSTLYTYYASPHYYAILLQQGRAIEPHLLGIKPIDHIRFSLLAALGCVAGFYQSDSFFVAATSNAAQYFDISQTTISFHYKTHKYSPLHIVFSSYFGITQVVFYKFCKGLLAAWKLWTYLYR